MKTGRDGLMLTTVDFTNVTITDAQVATMRKVVTANARDAADELLLMSALGIGDVA